MDQPTQELHICNVRHQTRARTAAPLAISRALIKSEPKPAVAHARYSPLGAGVAAYVRTQERCEAGPDGSETAVVPGSSCLAGGCAGAVSRSGGAI
jgi:hypothetical protein